MSGAVRRALQAAAAAGLLALQYGVATAYLSRGTWWHYLLHQMVGWGAGLAVAAAVTALTRYRVAALPALLAGQLLSIVPDLQFRYQRMPHEPAMDVYLGHISLHTGPSPVLVALGCLLLGGAAFLAADLGRPRLAVGAAAGSAGLVLVACLLAAPVPTSLSGFPADTPAPAGS